MDSHPQHEMSDGHRKGRQQTHTLSFFITCAIAFIVPLFFIPIPEVPFQFSKTAITALLVATLVILFGLRVLRSGTMSFSWSWLIIATLLLPLLYFISAAFSVQPTLSFFGARLETDTFGFILLASTLVISVSALNFSRARIFSVLMAFFASLGIAILFQVYQVFIGGLLQVPLFGSPLVNTVGSWNDFGILAGLMALMSLLAIEIVRLPRVAAFVAWFALLVSVAYTVLVNLPELWWTLGAIAFGIVLFSVSRTLLSSGVRKRHYPFASFSILVLSLVFTFFGGIVSPVQEALNVQQVEVRPSVEATFSVFSGTFSTNPIVGSGPGTFASQWLVYRPLEVLQSVFWNVGFTTGSGTIPSAMAVGGIVIVLAWLIFIIAFLTVSIRAFIVTAGDERSLFLVALTALGSLYLMALHVLYAPGQVITIALFLFIALFLSSLAGTPLVRTVSWSFKEAPRLGFIAVFISTVGIAISFGAIAHTGIAYTSVVYHNHALSLIEDGDFDNAFRAAERAAQLRPQDQFYRTLALIDFGRLNEILEIEEPTEEEQEAFRLFLTRAIENSGRAIAFNNQNFQNFLLRAALYGAVVPLQIQGAYDATVATLEQARALNQKSPEVDLRLARAHVVEGESARAKEAIVRALEKRPNYTDAILLRAQLEVEDGNLDEAIESLYGAVFFEPENPILLYQLGLLLIENESYVDAAEALEIALELEPNFANASFFLAHAYTFLNERTEAIRLLEGLVTNNQANDVVISYLDALRSGENPFESGAVSPDTESELEEVE